MKQYFHVKFPQEIIKEIDNIAQLELYTIVLAIKLWDNNLKGKVVQISTDNQISMFAINTGCTRDHFMLKCLCEIAWTCAKFQMLLRASYITSRQNKIPDALSQWYQGSEARRTFK